MGLLRLYDSLFGRHRAASVYPINIGLLFHVICLSALAAPVSDYTGSIQRWNITESSPQLSYYIDPSASSVASLIEQAESDWASVSGSYAQLVQVSSASSAQIIFTVQTTLALADASGLAVWSTTSAGTPLCTASILSSTAAGSGAFVTILHEAGHCLGLTHSVASGAIMSYRPGTDLSSDDRYAVTLLYPSGSSNVYPLGCASVHYRADNRDTLGSSVSFVFTLFIFLLLQVLVTLFTKANWNRRMP